MEMLLTVEQAARRLQVQPETIRTRLRRGQLRGVKSGKLWRVPETALLENTAPQERDNPLLRAVAMVRERDAKSGPVVMRIAGVNDAAADVRAVREAQTP